MASRFCTRSNSGFLTSCVCLCTSQRCSVMENGPNRLMTLSFFVHSTLYASSLINFPNCKQIQFRSLFWTRTIQSCATSRRIILPLHPNTSRLFLFAMNKFLNWFFYFQRIRMNEDERLIRLMNEVWEMKTKPEISCTAQSSKVKQKLHKNHQTQILLFVHFIAHYCYHLLTFNHSH